MPQFSERDVIELGQELPYQDGVEARISEILERVQDRSSTSDELASHITDWPSRYHFSRLRRNLFEPFRIHEGMRVLEIGCGMGANLVTLAETGAEVVGVEGSLSRARAARVRTSTQPNVTVYAGDVVDLPDLEPFDLVVMVGVLEYSMAGAGGARGPMALLERVASLLRPGGSLILAIENQLGLKYLLSYPEDHHSQPWVGLEGYPDEHGPRTWSRVELSALVREAGLADQAWLYPYPDYKLPTFIARERLFETDAGRDVIRQFLRDPVVDLSGSPVFVCDATRALDVMLSAQLGPDTANSFLLVASVDPGRSEALVRDGEAWVSSGERVQEFRSQRVVEFDEGRFELGASVVPSADCPATRTWLSNVGHPAQSVQRGECLDDLVVEAVRHHDIQRLGTLLGLYDAVLRDGRVEGTKTIDRANPFLFGGERDRLSGEYLDCTFKNIIVVDGEMPHFIDREWVASGGVDERIVRLRAYFELATRIAWKEIDHPWNPLMSIRDLVQTLRRHVADGWTDQEFDCFSLAEDEFQRIVGGQAQPEGVAELFALRLIDRRSTRPLLSLMRQAGSSETLRAELHEMSALHQQLSAAHEQLRAAHEDLIEDRVCLVEEIERFHKEMGVLRSDRDALRALLGDVIDARDSLQAEVESIRQSRSYRWARSLALPARVIRPKG